MTLKPGIENIRSNIKELMSAKPGKARAKGIRTLARRKKISIDEAKFRQALAIARSKAKHG